MEENQTQDTKQIDTIRVNVSLLNELMVYAGELVLSRNQLLRLSGDIVKKIPGLSGVLQDVDLTTSILQEKIMNTRMQPISLVFGKFPRVIRDLSPKINKKIKLDTVGNDINLDKSIIECLSEPLNILIHFITYYLLETPEERKRLKKDETCKIILKAYHEGGKVNVDIVDDGSGLNVKEILKEFIDAGMINEASAQKLSKKEIINLILTEGYYTFKITNEDGVQNVTLSNAREMLEKIGGTITIDSEPDRPTKINIKLPLTLVIVPSIIVSTQKQRFAIPQVSLREIVRITSEDKNRHIEMVNEAPVLRLRNKLLPIVYLDEVLGLPRQTISDQTVRILVLQHDDNEFGLAVQEIFDVEEIVVKTIPRFFKNSICYSGATIMGDGSVALIIDISGIAYKAKLHFNNTKEIKKDTDDDHTMQQDLQSLLLFEDKFETYALNLDLVKRIEKVENAKIELVGDKNYIEHEGKSLRIIKLADFLPVQNEAELPNIIYVIIPKMVDTPLGIIAYKIIDSVEVNLDMDVETITGKGLIGSTLIKDKLVLFPDIYELIEMAEPEKAFKYKQKKDQKHKVLLVEDTPFFRALEKQYLESVNFTVDIAYDGMDGWKKFQAGTYDLIVCDIVMPRMDGYEFISKVREINKTIPAVAVTTLADDEHKSKALEAGFSAYEVKLHKDKLLSTIKKILNQETEEEI